MSDFSDSEKVSYLFKKVVGKPNTISTKAFYEETSLPARSAIFSNKQIYAQKINDVAPYDLVALNDSSKDDNGDTIVGSAVGNTSATSGNTHIQRFIKLELEYVSGSGNPGAYKHAKLQDTIPFNYDPAGSYAYELYQNNGSTRIYDGVGEWFVDPEAGVLTFYHTNNNVSSSSLPKISFYRYNGLKGLKGSILDLSDTPSTLTADTTLKVNSAGTGITFSSDSSSSNSNIDGNLTVTGNTSVGNITIDGSIVYGTDLLNNWSSLSNRINVLDKSTTLLNLDHSNFDATGDLTLEMPVTQNQNNLVTGSCKTFILTGKNSNGGGATRVDINFNGSKLKDPAGTDRTKIRLNTIGQGVNLMWSGNYWFIVNSGGTVI